MCFKKLQGLAFHLLLQFLKRRTSKRTWLNFVSWETKSCSQDVVFNLFQFTARKCLHHRKLNRTFCSSVSFQGLWWKFMLHIACLPYILIYGFSFRLHKFASWLKAFSLEFHRHHGLKDWSPCNHQELQWFQHRNKLSQHMISNLPFDSCWLRCHESKRLSEEKFIIWQIETIHLTKNQNIPQSTKDLMIGNHPIHYCPQREFPRTFSYQNISYN